MGPFSNPKVKIPSGTSLSAAFSLGAGRIISISMPALWTAANLTFQASVDGITFEDVYDDSGNEIVVIAAAGETVRVRWALLPYCKVRSGTGGAPVNQEQDSTLSVLVCRNLDPLTRASRTGTAAPSTPSVAPHLAGLVAEYSLREGAGTTVLDTSGNALNGTFASGANAPAWSALGVTFGSSGTQNILLPDNVLANDNTSITDFSVEVWVNVSSNPSDGLFVDLCGELILGESSNGYEGGAWGGPSGVHIGTLDSESRLTLNAWEYVVLVRTGGTLSLYVNGTLDNSRDVTADPVSLSSSWGPKTLGDPRDGLIGILGEVRLYSRGLSAGEVTTLFSATRATYGV